MCVTEKAVILKETISPHARRVTCTVIPQILSLPCPFLLLFLKFKPVVRYCGISLGGIADGHSGCFSCVSHCHVCSCSEDRRGVLLECQREEGKCPTLTAHMVVLGWGGALQSRADP